MEQRINGHTRLYALIGSPVGHSGSPAMYNYSFAKLGLDCAYLAFDIPVEKTGAAIEAFRTLNVGGFNITMPDKTETARLVDRLSPAAEMVGACNTVVVEEDGTMTGHMTDGIGFVRNLKEHGVVNSHLSRIYIAIYLKPLKSRKWRAALAFSTRCCSR